MFLYYFVYTVYIGCAMKSNITDNRDGYIGTGAALQNFVKKRSKCPSLGLTFYSSCVMSLVSIPQTVYSSCTNTCRLSMDFN